MQKTFHHIHVNIYNDRKRTAPHANLGFPISAAAERVGVEVPSVIDGAGVPPIVVVSPPRPNVGEAVAAVKVNVGAAAGAVAGPGAGAGAGPGAGAGADGTTTPIGQH